MNINGNEELQCRICANYVGDENERINIFEENARRNFLQTKIRKYLYVLVSSEDRLPKMVCGNCVKRLDGIHRFATMAHRAQERLKSQFYCNSADSKEENDDFYGDSKNNYKGLLRTILSSKDGADISEVPSSPDSSIGPNGFQDFEETPSITEEMEVKVDPMVFLQCGLECSASPEVSDDDSDCDEKTLHIEESSGNEDTRLKCSSSPPARSPEDENPSNGSHEKPYNCTICPRTFNTQMALQNHLWFHLRRDYGDEKKIDDAISRDNTNDGVLIINQDSDNSDNGFGNSCFVCPICNKKISTKGNLKVHLETHRPKGKYGCDICGRIFKTQSNLFRHKEYHGGVQFPCSVCGRVYPTNSTLRAHSITHSDLRPHACPLCDKTFKRNQDLKFHINQHTGARPYQCPYCPKAFASSGNCFSHRKRMHPREVNRDRQRAADLMR